MLPLHPSSTSNKSRGNHETEFSDAEFLSPMNSINQKFDLNNSDNEESDDDEFVSAKGSFAAPKLRSIRAASKASKASKFGS